jgi:sugar phosphate isomerase/epimerase
MKTLHRRLFLQSSAALLASHALAIEPIVRPAKPELNLGLAAYSFNAKLNLKAKPKPEMTLEEFIDFTGEQKIPGIELTAYYFRENNEKYLKEIKSRCEKHGLAVSGTAVGNDFCHTDKTRLTAEFDMVKKWIDNTAILGGKTLRIFAGTLKKGDKEQDARKRVIEKIQEACEIAAKQKVILALENHGGITATSEQLLALVKGVKSEAFGVNLDTGNFRTADPYGDLEKLAPYAVVVQVKTEIAPGGKNEKADFKRIVDILRKVNYSGWVVLEYEEKEDPKIAVPKHLAGLKKVLS